MIDYEGIEISPILKSELQVYEKNVKKFRSQGSLDELTLNKLEEHFKASHIYHSAGIEGNRLTLQETVLVLSEGIDISGKPISQSVEVKDLGRAYDYLTKLSREDETIRETDIRDLHRIIVGDNEKVSPGEYRNTGVIISGSEHRPPEPLAVPGLMETLVAWINGNLNNDPIIVASIAHHELASIHPFKDGNGRVSRLIMNLILLKKGFPICNITKEKRPEYYENLTFADVGLYEPLIEMVFGGSFNLFSEYLRINEETDRAKEWAEKWGQTEAAVINKRESREMELWTNRMRQIYLEFERTSDLLDEEIQNLQIETYEYKSEISLDKFRDLKLKGSVEHTNYFSVTFKDKSTDKRERFMFRFFRNWDKFSRESGVIPLELNYFDENELKYIRVGELSWNDKLRVREIYYSEDGILVLRYFDRGCHKEIETEKFSIAEVTKMFFNDVLKNVFHLDQ